LEVTLRDLDDRMFSTDRVVTDRIEQDGPPGSRPMLSSGKPSSGNCSTWFTLDPTRWRMTIQVDNWQSLPFACFSGSVINQYA
jgi:hypothetical protein